MCFSNLGQLVCKENEPPSSSECVSVKTASTSIGPQGQANIVLNISLSPDALQGEGPVTVTAQTSIPPEHQRNNSSLNGSNGKVTPLSHRGGASMSGISGTKTPLSFPHSHVPHDKPLDLATGQINKSIKPSTSSSSMHQQLGKMSRSHSASNGVFSSLSGHHGDSPLAKRLRLSTEQAEAYTSASIMAASLSSASFLNERLRLQLMQAGMHVGDYGLDPHSTSGLMDLASSEALRSQLMQHYGIKSEPK